MNLDRLVRESRFAPNVHDVLASIFENYSFTLDGAAISSSEVFDPKGFLPVIGFVAAHRVRDMFGIEIDMGFSQDPDSLMGFRAAPVFNAPATAALFLLNANMVARETFGSKPQDICLDRLYEWAFKSDEAKSPYPPFLGTAEHGDNN